MSKPHSILSRVPLRWRISLLSAGLTFAVLCVFAVVIGQLTAGRIRGDFDTDMKRAFQQIKNVKIQLDARGRPFIDPTLLRSYAASGGSQLRILSKDGGAYVTTPGAPDFRQYGLEPGQSGQAGPYQVLSRQTSVNLSSTPGPVEVFLQYARPTGPLENTIGRVRLFLFLGVIAGTLVALVLTHGLLGRALAPITRLTRTARDVEQTADPARRVPVPDTADEVAELAQTLDRMLRRLDASRVEREAVLQRQRDFVADASHELRTPLTSVYANLELLAAVLEGEEREAASSALRSTQRMKRLVTDLLILARADARQQPADRPVDLSQVALDVIAELSPVSAGHHLDARTEPVLIDGVRDQLHRLTLNLVANAIDHTPAGTNILVTVRPHGARAILDVSDDGPGVPHELRPRIFDRFVRASGDRGGSTGLGLAIVQAVAESHGGTVEVGDSEQGGARFHVVLPRSASSRTDGSDDAGERPSGDEDSGRGSRLRLRRQTSTTTGSTIGRRLSRS